MAVAMMLPVKDLSHARLDSFTAKNKKKLKKDMFCQEPDIFLCAQCFCASHSVLLRARPRPCSHVMQQQ